jgi:signal transduction histidine kinase
MPQLVLLTACALLISIALHAAFTLRQQTEVSRLSIEHQASALARNLAVASTNLIVLGSIDGLDDLLERSVDFPDILELRITDADGRILSHFARSEGRVRRIFDAPGQRLALPAAVAPALTSGGAGGQRRIVASHPVVGGTLLGWVQADISTEALDELGRRILLTTIVAALLAVVGSSLLLFLFLRRTLGAMEQARRFAVDLHVSAGRSLPPISAALEIEDLAAALNYASVSLHQQRQQLASTVEQLMIEERIIRDRTEQLNTIFSLSPDGLVSFDRDGLVKYANPAFLRMTGLLAMDVVGQAQGALERRLRELAEVPGQWPGLEACFLRVAVATDQAGAAAAPEQRQRQLLSLRAPRASVLDLIGVSSDAATVSQLLYVRDVTHEIEVDRMKSEFLSHAAHELRTPMASIFGFSELLITQDFDEATRKDLLATIHRQTAWLVDIINELLDLARIESRRGKDFHIEEVPLASLVGDVVSSMQIDQARWPLSIDCPECLAPVRADGAKLRQALTNVLGNAVKYSPRGGAIDIRCVSCERDGRAFGGIVITDHGIGMTPEQVARAYERFYRADTSGNIPGTGLGMTIVKEIIGLLGGTVDLVSEPGVGTCITLWIPAREIHDLSTSTGAAPLTVSVRETNS